MAHNLNYNDQTNQHSFFSVKEKAWHSLGQNRGTISNFRTGYSVCGFRLFCRKAPVVHHSISNDLAELSARIEPPKKPVPAYFATVRNDNDAVFGVVGKDYKVVQNAQAFTFFDAIIGGGDGILYETAEALGNAPLLLPSYRVLSK